MTQSGGSGYRLLSGTIPRAVMRRLAVVVGVPSPAEQRHRFLVFGVPRPATGTKRDPAPVVVLSHGVGVRVHVGFFLGGGDDSARSLVSRSLSSFNSSRDCFSSSSAFDARSSGTALERYPSMRSVNVTIRARYGATARDPQLFDIPADMGRMRRRCADDQATYRVVTILGRHRATCSCGWTSAFVVTSTTAIEVWGRHRARRATDAIGSLRREQAVPRV